MSTDGTFERLGIMARLQAYVLGGRVYDGLPDDEELARSENGRVKPYASFHMGTIYALTRGRSITGEEDQPHVMPFTVECRATTQQAARDAAGAIRNLLIGWQPSPGSEAISAPGGSSYRDRDAAGAPTLFVEAVALETVINMGSNDGYVPTPGVLEPGGESIPGIEAIIEKYLAEHSLAYERHDFPIPVGEWTGVHALGRIPSLTTYSLDGTRLLSDSVATETGFVVTWADPTAGFVILT